MVADGLITRRTVNTRTYEIALVNQVSNPELHRLQSAAASNRAKFPAAPLAEQTEALTPAEAREKVLADLIDDCSLIHLALQEAAAAANMKTDQGRAALNASAIFKELGFNRARAKELRHYLRELNLASAVKVCDHDPKLYWWTVSVKELNPDALRKVATGNRSYEDVASLRTVREDSRREKTYAGSVPSVLPDRLCGEVTVRRIEKPKVPEETPAQAAVKPAEVVKEIAPAEPQPTPAVPTDRVAALVKIIGELEAGKAALEDQLKEVVEAAKEKISSLEARNAALQQQLSERSEVDTTADQLIEKYLTNE